MHSLENNASVKQSETSEAIVEELVLRVLRESGKSLQLAEIVDGVGDKKKTRIFESAIREAVWRLIRRGLVELTEDRKFKLSD